MTDMAEELRERIEAIFSDHLGVELDSRDTDVFAEGHVDSLMFVDLVMALESEFEITIMYDQLDFDNFHTVNSIAEFVAKHFVGDQGH